MSIYDFISYILFILEHREAVLIYISEISRLMQYIIYLKLTRHSLVI